MDNEQAKIIEQITKARHKVSYHSSFLAINDGQYSFMHLYKTKKIKLPEINQYRMWDENEQSQFIESLLLNCPIPTIIMLEEEGYQRLIKGAEYLLAISNFITDGLELKNLTSLTELNGYTYSKLPSSAKAYLNNASLYVNTLNIKTKENEKELIEKLNLIYY